MSVNRRTQVARSAATRAALVDAARELFALHGYGAVATEAVVRSAGVTRGALYHQFADKAELFAAVLEEVEVDVGRRIDARITELAPPDRLAAMRIGSGAWLDACAEPDVQRIVLIDGPAVLGYERWREIGLRHGVGLIEALLAAAMDAGEIPRRPVSALAHVLASALDEAALFVHRAEDRDTARAEVDVVIDALIAGLRAPAPLR